MKTKKTSTLSDKIAASLRDAINHGELKPNDNVIEREIAEKYETSHIPVREALRILEGEGFVVHRKFAGSCAVRNEYPERKKQKNNRPLIFDHLVARCCRGSGLGYVFSTL